jgi:oxygen-dependent protoporphyrinogen oxidase
VPSGLIVVIGGGISGLGVAYSLHQAGVPVRLIEADAEVGGVIRSIRTDGFLIESGPNSALNSSLEVERVVAELGLLPERVFASPSSRKRYIVKRGVPIPLPTGLWSFVTTPLWSGRAKRRLFAEPFASPAPPGDESIANFTRRRLGVEFLEYAVDPFVSGVYAGDPEALSLAATFPRLAALERDHGGLIRGAIAGISRPKEAKPVRRGIYSFRDGLAALPRAIGARLGEGLWVNARVRQIERAGAAFRVQVDRGGGAVQDLDAAKVVVATPTDVAAGLLRVIAPGLAEDLLAIVYAPIAVVFTAFPRTSVAHPLDGFGCLVPGREQRTILGSLWTSSFFPGRAPDGLVALTTFVGGARHPDLTALADDSLVRIVCEDLARLFGVGGPPAFARVIRHPRAIPQYLLGHGERVARITRAVEAIPGLALAGNYLSGVAVGDCLARGVELGRRLSR